MTEMNNRYLGLDLSLSSPGFAVISVQNGIPYLLEATHVKTDAKLSHGERLHQINRALLVIVNKYGEFDAVIRERGFSRFPSITQTLFKVVGATEELLAERGYTKIHEIPPTTVKSLVAGNGKAKKPDVMWSTLTWLNIDSPTHFKTDDESDAAAVVLAYLLKEGVISK